MCFEISSLLEISVHCCGLALIFNDIYCTAQILRRVRVRVNCWKKSIKPCKAYLVIHVSQAKSRSSKSLRGMPSVTRCRHVVISGSTIPPTKRNIESSAVMISHSAARFATQADGLRQVVNLCASREFSLVSIKFELKMRARRGELELQFFSYLLVGLGFIWSSCCAGGVHPSLDG